jgi:hypothetical protein
MARTRAAAEAPRIAATKSKIVPSSVEGGGYLFTPYQRKMRAVAKEAPANRASNLAGHKANAARIKATAAKAAAGAQARASARIAPGPATAQRALGAAVAAQRERTVAAKLELRKAVKK